MSVTTIPARWRLLPVAAVLASSLVLVACGDKKEKGASQTAAKVNKEEITVHQINFVLQQQRGLKPEQADAASQQILERLIDQELAVQKADELKLDRDPRVVQQLEAVRREVLARAYAEKVGEGAAKPSAEDIKKYYDENPALFGQRRIYSLQEIQVEVGADQLPALRAKLTEAKSINDFIEHLKSSGLKFSGNQAVRPAEQLPLASLKTLSAMKDGQAVITPTPTGAVVVVLAGSRSQPVSEDQARPAIEQFLLNDRKRKLLDDDRKTLRSGAAIQYVGKFGQGASAAAGSAPAAPPATTPTVPTPTAPTAPAVPVPNAAPPEAPASSGMDPAAISKGLGLK